MFSIDKLLISFMLILNLLVAYTATAQDSRDIDYSYEDKTVRPNQVSIQSRLIGRLDWGYDSYYEIDLLIDGSVVASTTEIPNRTSELLSFLRGKIDQAKTQKKYMIVKPYLFNYNSYRARKALIVSSQDLPVPPVVHCVECENRLEGEPEVPSLFGRLLRHKIQH